MTVFVCFRCDLAEEDNCTYVVNTSSISGMDNEEFSTMKCPFGIENVKWVKLEVPKKNG